MPAPEIFILGTPGFVSDYEDLDVPTFLEAVGANSGNLIFQHAVTGILGDSCRYVGRSGEPYMEAIKAKSGFLVFPAANLLREDAQLDLLCDFLKGLSIPIIVIGLGMQGEKGEDFDDLVRRIQENKSVVRFVDLLKRKAKWITVRGPRTHRMLCALGVEDSEVLGCPSLMINRSDTLGRDVEIQLSDLRSKKEVSFVYTADELSLPAESNRRKLELWAMSLLVNSGQKGHLVQQSGGTTAVVMAESAFAQSSLARLKRSLLIRATGRLGSDARRVYSSGKTHVFGAAISWIDFVGDFDVCFGSRLHGNMAALASGTPGIIHSHDSRTDELTDTMLLPSVKFPKGGFTDLEDLVSRVEFDGRQFDENRVKVASKYVDGLGGLGISTKL